MLREPRYQHTREATDLYDEIQTFALWPKGSSGQDRQRLACPRLQYDDEDRTLDAYPGEIIPATRDR